MSASVMWSQNHKEQQQQQFVNMSKTKRAFSAKCERMWLLVSPNHRENTETAVGGGGDIVSQPSGRSGCMNNRGIGTSRPGSIARGAASAAAAAAAASTACSGVVPVARWYYKLAAT